MRSSTTTTDENARSAWVGSDGETAVSGSEPPASLLWRLLTVAFIGGFVVLALEILGFRMFAPYFGYSVYVSGSLISLVLIALTAGYYVGGILADRSPSGSTLFILLLIASGYLALVACLYTQVLSALSRLPPTVATGIAALVIFAPPMTLLSTVMPFAVKLISSGSHSERIGSIVGAVSAVSTLGSIVGSLTTTFVLIPMLGTRVTLIICVASVLPAMLLVGALPKGFVKVFSLIPVLLACISWTQDAVNGRPILRRESPYNTVKVYKNGDTYRLVLNNDRDLQSEFNARRPFAYSYTTHFLAACPMAGGTDVLILGLGGGTSANQTRLVYPAARVEAVEIDPEVCRVAEQYFRVKDYNPSLRIHVADARSFLGQCSGQYDVIQADMFQGGPYAPFYVTTREFFAAAKRHLKQGGVLAYNVFRNARAADGDCLYLSVADTLLEVFPSVFVFKADRLPYNALLFALSDSISVDGLRERTLDNVGRMPRGYDVAPIVQHVLDNLSACNRDRSCPILTDDRAPVEWLTHRVLRSIKPNLLNSTAPSGRN